MAAMGRRRSRNHGLPQHMAQKGQAFYYVTNDRQRRWIGLGTDYMAALVEWAKLEGGEVPEQARTFSQVAAWYVLKGMNSLAPRTAKDYKACIKRLSAVFGDSPVESIRPADVRIYLDERISTKKLKEGEEPKQAQVRANREIAVLSIVINFARERGFTDMANPCPGVRRNKETGRDRYEEDAEFDAIYAKGDEVLQDAMDLLLLTSQRPGDVIKMKRTDLKAGLLWVRQGKTKTPLRISEEADLAAALDRMMNRKRSATGVMLVQDDAGQPLTYWQLEDRYNRARAAAAVDMPSVADLQMRDIRGKTATDLDDLAHAQLLLGHKTRAMTERYVKQRAGARVAPHRRKKA